MDQLKKIMAQAARHQFWIITGVSVLLGAVGFFLASSTIGKLFSTQKTALDGHYTNIQTVRSAVPTHPNEKSQEQMNLIIDRLAGDVKAAWEEQYNKQARFLQWPDSIRRINPVLVRLLESYRPVELKLTYPNEPNNLTKGLKQAYARYFDEDMPRLAKIIGVEWVGEASSAASQGMGGYGMGMGGGGYGAGDDGYGDEGGYGGMGGMGGMYGGGMSAADANKPRDLVTWPKTSQDELLSGVKMWNGDTPSVYQILYTQENMWILEGLLNIIKKTNGNAQANFQCVIKEIEFIRIGKNAAGQAGEIMGASSSAGGMYGDSMGYGGGGYGAGGDGEAYGEDYDPYGGSMMGGESQFGGGAEPVIPDPANNRYVDANYTPVSGDDLRTKMASSSPEDAYFAVAKRVPVRLRFKIDQRQAQKFIANCGNADLMLEVRQVRIGDTVAAGGPGGGGMGGYGMGGGAPGAGGLGGGIGGMGGGEEGGYGEGDMYSAGAGTTTAAADFDLPIEVYGIVYLFNPVDIERLGLNQVTEDTVMTDTVEAQPEAAAPAQPAAPGNGAGGNDAANNGAAGDAAAAGGAGANPAAPANAGQGNGAANPAGENAGNGATAGQGTAPGTPPDQSGGANTPAADPNGGS